MENKIITSRYGKCRFCSTKGIHKHIMKKYVQCNGTWQVYYELFQECFNINLCTNPVGSSLICSSCAESLQDASRFRAMVVESEAQLLNTLDDKSFFVDIDQSSMDIDEKNEEKDSQLEKQYFEGKDKSSEMEDIYFDLNTDMVDGNSEDKFKGYLEVKPEKDLVEGEEELLARFSSDSLKPLPSRKALQNEPYFQHLESLKAKIITADSIRKLIDPAQKRLSSKIYITEKMAHITNISTILQHSNLAAFKTKRRSGVPCFYCSRICDNFELLHIHQMDEKCKKNIKRLLHSTPSERLVVYVHINENIKCTICEQKQINLNELKLHLSRIHKKKMYAKYEDRIIPFKLIKPNHYECMNCGFNFETFGAVERHMTVHYRNYVCDQCGAGYVTKSRLKVHLKCSHIRGTFPCEICKKIFDTKVKYKTHVDSVHKMVKKNLCPKCPMRFSDYFHRSKHMADAHGYLPLRFKCNVCGTLFKRRYALSCHMKRVHLDFKDVQCNLCAYKCCTSGELKAHMVKHNGERTYECTVCKKSYARKKTLKEHMRIHNNDKRFVCVVCGQAFVQNCSLKGHMKTHHQIS